METPNFETLGKRKSIQENLTPRTASSRTIATNPITKTASKSESSLKTSNATAPVSKSSSVQNLTLSKEQLKYVDLVQVIRILTV